MESYMKLNYVFLKLLVWNMRWMTRYAGFITRPFVRWYASQEIIACGLRNENGEVCIIYSPKHNREEHSFFKNEHKNWTIVHAARVNNFSGDIMNQVTVPNAHIGDVYIVRAQKRNSRRVLRSPTITVKKDTSSAPDIMNVQPLSDGKLRVSWAGGERFDPMIYFLAVEDEHGNALTGIYTRECWWKYPDVKSASLSVGNIFPPPFEHNMWYTIKLVIVDFDGWVSCIAKKVFKYNDPKNLEKEMS